MNPRLFGTEIAPKYIVYGKAATSRLVSIAVFSFPLMVFVVKKAAMGMNTPHKVGMKNRWT